MRIIIFILFFSLIGTTSHAQSLKKYTISNSGCTVYMFCDPGKFSVSKSEDGSDVYTGKCTREKLTIGVICVKLKDKITNLDDAQSLVIAYLDYLKQQFEVKAAVGYGKGNQLNNNEKTIGVVDFWEDKDGNKIKIRGWTDGAYIGVLYGVSQEELPDTKLNVFLESFRMPGM